MRMKKQFKMFNYSYSRRIGKKKLNPLRPVPRLIKQLGKKGKMLKSIVCTYPDFRELPKGLKQMLVVSETLFFSEVQAPAKKPARRDVGNKPLMPQEQNGIFINRCESPPAELHFSA